MDDSAHGAKLAKSSQNLDDLSAQNNGEPVDYGVPVDSEGKQVTGADCGSCATRCAPLLFSCSVRPGSP